MPPAGQGPRPAALRRRPSRPQLKRDPLGGDRLADSMRIVVPTFCAILLACGTRDVKEAATQLPRADGIAERPADSSDAQPQFRIPHIEAHLIFKDGQLSDDIIGPHPWVLWNTIIGEGDATDRQTGVHHPSEATLVRVVVSGPPNRTLADAKVKLVVIGLGPSDTVIDVALPSLDSAGSPSGQHTRKVTLPGMGRGPSTIVMEGALTRFDSTGTQLVPFRLDGTGCERIGLTAHLIGDRVLDSLHAEIPFECGE